MEIGAKSDGKGPERSSRDANCTTESVTGKDSRGRIFKMRLSVNPNSSGHGILFGSMFFIPYSSLSSIMANAVVSGLDDALVSYRDTRAEPSRADRALAVTVWTLAWAGLAAIWAVLLSTMILIAAPIWGWVLLGTAATLPIAFLAYRAAVNPAVVLLAKRSPKPCLWGFVLGVFTVLVIEPSGVTYDIWGAILLYAYATPLALVLAAGAARAARLVRRAKDLIVVAIAYIVVGLVLVFPAPPISRTSYNPVGMFFPVWGFGVPWAMMMLSLARLSRTVGLKVSKIGPDASWDRPDVSKDSLDMSDGGADASKTVDFLP